MIHRCMCLSKRLLSKIMYHVLYMMFDVWKFTMSYPFCITRNDPLTYEMQIFSTHNWCTSFNKLHELFNLILLLVTDAWHFDPTSIHVSFSVILTRLSHMDEDLNFFIKGVRKIFFYTWLLCQGYVSSLKFDKILTAFRIGLQVRKMKVVTSILTTRK